MAKSRPPCHYCGVKLRDGTFTWDHIVPKSRGGRDAQWNRVPCCGRCNKEKGSLGYREHCLACSSSWFQHEVEGRVQLRAA